MSMVHCTFILGNAIIHLKKDGVIMLANRLNVLLAERQLTNKQVVEATGLSRNSISNIINNPEANIATDTVDRLCLYLGVTPTDFFSYAPYSFKYDLDISNGSAALLIWITHNQKTHINRYNLHFSNVGDDVDSLAFDYFNDPLAAEYNLYVTVSADSQEYGNLENVMEELPVAFKNRITNEMLSYIEKGLFKESNNLNISITPEYRKPPYTDNLKGYLDDLKGASIGVSLRFPWADMEKSFNLKTGKFE
jgi:DNA-binding Xre family transcriptional regulator